MVISLSLAPLGCKTKKEDSQGRSLDHFLNDHLGVESQRNSCQGEYPVLIDHVTTFNTTLHTDEKMLSSVAKAASAIPPFIQFAFTSAGGQVEVRDDASQRCLQATGSDTKSCWTFDQIAGLKIIIDSDPAEISHGLVRSFAYIFSEYLIRLDDTKSPAVIDHNKAAQFDRDAAQIMFAFKDDLEHRLTPQELAKINLDYRDANQDVFAEAFDSYFCSPKTLKIMEQDFPKTYHKARPVFEDIKLASSGEQRSLASFNLREGSRLGSLREGRLYQAWQKIRSRFSNRDSGSEDRPSLLGRLLGREENSSIIGRIFNRGGSGESRFGNFNLRQSIQRLFDRFRKNDQTNEDATPVTVDVKDEPNLPANNGESAPANDSTSQGNESYIQQKRSEGPPQVDNALSSTRFSQEAFASADKIYEEVRIMNDFGPRHTGSQAHIDYINYIKAWMENLNMEIKIDTVKIQGHNALSTGGPKSGDTDHIAGILKGETDEIIIIGCHSDGANAIEENGVPVSMVIADYLAKLPSRKYTYAFVFPTGHMSDIEGGIEALSWAKLNRDITRKTVATVSPEHLGARGDRFYLTASGAFRKKTEELSKKYSLKNTAVRRLGIGSGLAWRAAVRKPLISGMTIGLNLFNARIGMEKIDKDHLYSQSLFFAEMVTHLETLDKKDMGSFW